jgi:hypothetical protein
MPALERHLQASVLRHLKLLRAADSSLIFRKRPGTAGAVAGDPDITGLWRGVHFELELKQHGANPTPLQELRLQEWAAAGAIVAVVRSLDDLKRALARVTAQHQA